MAKNDDDKTVQQKAVEPTDNTPEAQKKAEAAKAVPTNKEAAAKRGPLRVAVNAIHQTNPETGEPEVIEPGTPFEPAAVDMEFLTRTAAIREPSEGEVALYQRVKDAEAANANAAESSDLG